jgi:Fe-S oxidoreductase
MARLKTEFLAHYYTVHPRRKRDYLFAHIDALSRLASGWRAPLANWALSLGVTKSILDRWFGISQDRSLPSFSREPVGGARGEGRGARGRGEDEERGRPGDKERGRPGDKERGRGGDQEDGGRWHVAGTKTRANLQSPNLLISLVLFVDTYTAYSYPHVAHAAVEVLAACGCEVTMAPVTDAGRPALSKGMIDLARAKAQQVVAALHPYAAAGRPIIFLEPSDWSAVVDDYAALLLGDARLPVVAAACVTFEQFVAGLDAPLAFRDEPAAALLHGHCHQKALLGVKPAVQALARAGYTVTEIDSTCCGMAGAFGYEKEHVAVSLQMAEHGLAPAVRAASAETVIVAAGTSCRQQILSVTGRRALHPAEALAARLARRQGLSTR